MSTLSMSRSKQDEYRLRSKEVPLVHIRKRCACGQVVTAKQLVQYGKCEKCRGVKP